MVTPDPRFRLPAPEMEPCVHCGQPTFKAIPESKCEECRAYFAGGFNVVIPKRQAKEKHHDA
jgi:hypothetical protein